MASDGRGSQMKQIPKTSESLLIALAGDPKSVRWYEFVQRYEPMMRAYLGRYWAGVDVDEVVQSTLCALVTILPNYHYCKGENGLFRSYLTGVVRNKAREALRAAERRQRNEVASGDLLDSVEESDDEGAEWRHSIYEIALRELFDNPAIQVATKEVFRRIALEGEDPKSVAASFGMTRDNADKIKSRMLERLRNIVRRLEKCSDCE